MNIRTSRGKHDAPAARRPGARPVTGAGPRAGGWMEDPGFGVYVHIPFCIHRCHYCDFNTYEKQDALHGPYVEALIRDIERSPGDHPPATSVFFGGGTPTLLAPVQLARILTAIRTRFGLVQEAEITAEANPESIGADDFGRLLEAGFNRFSIGVQSLAPHVLEGLGRKHSVDVAVQAYGRARDAGVEDLNVDLIYGSPWETTEDWVRTIDRVVELEPDHVSAYALTIEEGTPLATLIETGRMPDVDPDVQAERHAIADERLEKTGYSRYEISNWAKPRKASRHNVLYWSAGDYLGFGAGAHGHLDGLRYWNVRLPRDFIDRVEEGVSTEDGHERLEGRARQGEALMLGLRLTRGIDLPSFKRRFGSEHLEDRADEIDDLISQGLLQRRFNTLRLTDEATMLANEVAHRLL